MKNHVKIAKGNVGCKGNKSGKKKEHKRNRTIKSFEMTTTMLK
jgi:hypothetical protein